MENLTTHKNDSYKNMVDCVYVSSVESPVISLKATLLTDIFPPDYGNITLYKEGKCCFTGKIDLQHTTMDHNGFLLHIEARSKGSLLLDNQAMPQTLWGANLTTIFLRYLSPLGFVLSTSLPATNLPEFEILPGESIWQMFVNFTEQLHGITPYVQGDTIYCENISCSHTHLFSNHGEGLRFSKLDHKVLPYNILSKVFLKDHDGFYSTFVENSNSRHFQVKRERYLPQKNGNAIYGNRILKNSMLQSEIVTIECPYFFFPDLGDFIIIKQDSFTTRSWSIRQITININQQGTTTKCILCNPEYI